MFFLLQSLWFGAKGRESGGQIQGLSKVKQHKIIRKNFGIVHLKANQIELDNFLTEFSVLRPIIEPTC